MSKIYLMQKDFPALAITENGECKILDFYKLPFGLRRERVTFPDFVEWASNRTLSMGRSYAKEILNTLRISQTNRYEVCLVCRGLSLEDSYWIRQEEDEKSWEDVNLFHNELSLFLTKVALSGNNSHYEMEEKEFYTNRFTGKKLQIHTPELTTLGVSAKAWIRGADGSLWLHKAGKYELPSSQILEVLSIPHISYEESSEEELWDYLSDERRGWLDGVGEKMVKSCLFTNPDLSMVTFEEFSAFCGAYGRNPYEEALRVDRRAYLQMQIADYILNNDDRHGQNWGFFVENDSGKITGFCPLFDHDHSFSSAKQILSRTTWERMTLEEAARIAQRELQLSFSGLFAMEKPEYLEEEKWEQVLDRGKAISRHAFK